MKEEEKLFPRVKDDGLSVCQPVYGATIGMPPQKGTPYTRLLERWDGLLKDFPYDLSVDMLRQCAEELRNAIKESS